MSFVIRSPRNRIVGHVCSQEAWEAVTRLMALPDGPSPQEVSERCSEGKELSTGPELMPGPLKDMVEHFIALGDARAHVLCGCGRVMSHYEYAFFGACADCGVA